MGRLIDVADLNVALAIGVLYGNKTAIQVINEAPTVEAIPKDQYEARLKADMVNMLTEIQLEIDEIPINADNSEPFKLGQASAYDKCENLIQQKINKLKENIE